MATFITNTSHKSRKKALVICTFGGWLGLHYFYVGRFIRGFFTQFTLNFFFIGWSWDVWKIMRGRFKDQHGEFLKEW